MNVATPQHNCKGNGITLGVNNGSVNYGLMSRSGYSEPRFTTSYGTSVGTNSSFTDANATKTLGLTTDASKSGIVAVATTSTISNYQNARGIIKY